MRFVEFQRQFRRFGVFSCADIRQVEPGFDRRRLHEWNEKGYLKKVVKGYYIFADAELNEEAVFEIANRVYIPSYVSFETALAYYGLIPESIYGVTSVSTRKTARFKTPLGEFSYRTISRKLYFGFEFIQAGSRMCKVASPEKALLDFFYLRPDVREAGDFEELRVDRAVLLRTVNRGRMKDYLSVYPQRSLKKRVESFWRYIGHA